ncbi:MAG: hypothetical protein IJU92_04410 [Spirochaetaceae bacterium]|nr:hypothetical protein [Spirochaetaceae bacterium]
MHFEKTSLFFQSGRELKYIMFFLILALTHRLHPVDGFVFSTFPLESLTFLKHGNTASWHSGLKGTSRNSSRCFAALS